MRVLGDFLGSFGASETGSVPIEGPKSPHITALTTIPMAFPLIKRIITVYKCPAFNLLILLDFMIPT
jgi:hypothetical protein